MKILKKSAILAISLILALFALSSCMDTINSLLGNNKPDDKEPVVKSEYTVSFDTRGAPAIAPITVKAGKRIYEPYGTMIKRGAEFNGWYYNGEPWDFVNNTVNSDMTLVANWKLINYKITYDLRGGSYSGNMPKSFTIESDTLTLGIPTRENYEFVAWEINGKRTNEIPKGTNEDISVVAIWYGLEAEIMPAKGGADGIVAFIHDDAKLNTMAIFDELLQKYGMVSDVGFLLNTVYNNNTVNQTALANYKVYINNGRWKIVNHSATHRWWGSEVTEGGTTFLKEDAASMQYELVFSQQKMRELFPGQKVLTFAYPGFSSYEYKYDEINPNILRDVIYSPTARKLIETHHISARMYNGGYTELDNDFTEWNYLNAQFLSADFINNKLDKLLRDTVANGYLNVLSFHGLTNDESQYNSDPGYYIYGSDMDKAMQKIDAYVKDGKIWNTHYEDAVLYIREAQTAKTEIIRSGENILLTLTDEMDDNIYDAAITVRVKNYGEWEAAKVVQGESTTYVTPITKDGETFIQLDLVPDKGQITISPIKSAEIPQNN